VCRELFAIKMRRGGGAGLGVARAAESDGTDRMHAPTGHVGICVGSSPSTVCALPTVAVACSLFPLFSPSPCCRRLSPLASLVYPAPPTPRVSFLLHLLPRFYLNVPPSFSLSLRRLPTRFIAIFYCIVSDDLGVSC